MTILYKYYSCGGGKAALKSQNLGFRKPEFFNDPFELTALSNNIGPASKQETLKLQIDELKDQVVILCLTRSAFNPLMWAHYADEHQGFVIGYDVSGPFLNSPDYNLITVESGDVLYTNTKTPFPLNPESMGALLGVYQHALGFEGAADQALARRLLLTKHASWVYEEEVRVVKKLIDWTRTVEEDQADPLRSYYTLTRNLEPGEVPGFDFEPGSCVAPLNENARELYLFGHKVPIREVYLGARSTYEEDPNFAELFQPGRQIFKLDVNQSSWSFESREIFSK
ncbi:DUF2971 domain-containing protein [Pseudomonas sp. TMW 2.1634]|uniref:DUF2971 domain-containing protein n=1 Tax=Pseudomonas sp. TMW 2.1634 TaxID=1886807 RepID=UPI000E735C2D|nr:DUF2971 domain-containing protein [Pseudomonas sp. TMW 2.1634]AOA09244.1 hypothetical protein BFC21_25825 [Pseudomonas sp. TMW 2.1634]